MNNCINYLELPSRDLAKTKAFFSDAFGWRFTDYGPDYTCFLDVGIDGGFYTSDKCFSLDSGAPLLVIYALELSLAQAQVEKAGGEITKPVFSFPGGRRFHFRDPTGNEYAVWSE